jgi:hypothetical protein
MESNGAVTDYPNIHSLDAYFEKAKQNWERRSSVVYAAMAFVSEHGPLSGRIVYLSSVYIATLKRTGVQESGIQSSDGSVGKQVKMKMKASNADSNTLKIDRKKDENDQRDKKGSSTSAGAVSTSGSTDEVLNNLTDSINALTIRNAARSPLDSSPGVHTAKERDDLQGRGKEKEKENERRSKPIKTEAGTNV